jgi:hypothetical protein
MVGWASSPHVPSPALELMPRQAPAFEFPSNRQFRVQTGFPPFECRQLPEV